MSTGSDKTPPIYWRPDAGFIRRTIVATLVTLALVGLNVGVYGGMRAGALYLLSGLWALIFFSLTPLVFKVWVFEGRRWSGIGLLSLKMTWFLLLVPLIMFFGVGEEDDIGAGLTMAGGVITPLLVLTFRALGASTRKR